MSMCVHLARSNERKSSVYSYEQEGTVAFPAEDLRLFKKNQRAWQ